MAAQPNPTQEVTAMSHSFVLVTDAELCEQLHTLWTGITVTHGDWSVSSVSPVYRDGVRGETLSVRRYDDPIRLTGRVAHELDGTFWFDSDARKQACIDAGVLDLFVRIPGKSVLDARTYTFHKPSGEWHQLVWA